MIKTVGTEIGHIVPRPLLDETERMTRAVTTKGKIVLRLQSSGTKVTMTAKTEIGHIGLRLETAGTDMNVTSETGRMYRSSPENNRG